MPTGSSNIYKIDFIKNQWKIGKVRCRRQTSFTESTPFFWLNLPSFSFSELKYCWIKHTLFIFINSNLYFYCKYMTLLMMYKCMSSQFTKHNTHTHEIKFLHTYMRYLYIICSNVCYAICMHVCIWIFLYAPFYMYNVYIAYGYPFLYENCITIHRRYEIRMRSAA